jgi:hypothetical protein
LDVSEDINLRLCTKICSTGDLAKIIQSRIVKIPKSKASPFASLRRMKKTTQLQNSSGSLCQFDTSLVLFCCVRRSSVLFHIYTVQYSCHCIVDLSNPYTCFSPSNMASYKYVFHRLEWVPFATFLLLLFVSWQWSSTITTKKSSESSESSSSSSSQHHEDA